jgi:hypothetical protein
MLLCHVLLLQLHLMFLLMQNIIKLRLSLMKVQCKHLMLVLGSLLRHQMFFLSNKNIKCCFNIFVISHLYLDLIWGFVIFVWEISLSGVALNCERLILKKSPMFFYLLGWCWGFTKEFIRVGVLMLHSVLLICINPLLTTEDIIFTFKELAHWGPIAWPNNKLV